MKNALRLVEAVDTFNIWHKWEQLGSLLRFLLVILCFFGMAVLSVVVPAIMTGYTPY